METEPHWIRPEQPDDGYIWGRTDGIVFGIPSKNGMRGPRGLIRLGRLDSNGKPYLINFIAIEPTVPGTTPRLQRMGFSELEPSDLDPGRNGKRLWTGYPPGTLYPSKPGSGRSGFLEVQIDCEQFTSNLTRVYVLARIYEDAPDELELEVHHVPASPVPEELVLTATMGNKGRLRQLWLADRIVDSRDIFSGYTQHDFIEKESYPAENMLRWQGDPIVLATSNEKDPASIRIPGSPSWEYHFAPLTHYWRVPAADAQENLRVRVNGRYVYWFSRTPIPGGVSYENFELRQRYEPGQRLIFGMTAKEPSQFDPAIPGLPRT